MHEKKSKTPPKTTNEDVDRYVEEQRQKREAERLSGLRADRPPG